VHHRFRSTFADLFQRRETLVGFEHTPKVRPADCASFSGSTSCAYRFAGGGEQGAGSHDE
jgi:hypothetical protein